MLANKTVTRRMSSLHDFIVMQQTNFITFVCTNRIIHNYWIDFCNKSAYFPMAMFCYFTIVPKHFYWVFSSCCRSMEIVFLLTNKIVNWLKTFLFNRKFAHSLQAIILALRMNWPFTRLHGNQNKRPLNFG